MIPFIILRHGPTDWNEDRRLQGRADRPLSAAGRRAVARWSLPGALHTWRWHSSPLARARETAALLGLNASPDEALIEMDWGEWEGHRLGALREALGDEMAENEDRGLDFRPPGGETPREALNRLRPFLARLAASGEPAGAVAHRGIIRALYCHASGWDLRGKPPVKLASACFHRFRIHPGGAAEIEALNLPLEP